MFFPSVNSKAKLIIMLYLIQLLHLLVKQSHHLSSFPLYYVMDKLEFIDTIAPQMKILLYNVIKDAVNFR